MLTIGAYVSYVRQPPSKVRYGVVVLLYALGLLSKNMLVTLPFVLLLLDYWPLKRFSGFAPPKVLIRLVAEKITLFVLAFASCIATVLSPEKVTFSKLPFALRMENAAISYVTYLWQMIYPSGLACLYPNPTNHIPLWQVAGAVGFLLAISGMVFAFRRTQPCLLIGWLWYLGMMIPVIGIVQISYYARADRYTYLPQIGIYLLLAWAASDLCVRWRHRRLFLAGLSTVILAALIVCAHKQASYWRNSEVLWTHAVACTSDNDTAQFNLAEVLLKKGRVDEAITHYRQALQINPDVIDVQNDLGVALFQSGNVDEAIVHYQQALKINPDHARVHFNLGNALLQKGNVDEAIVHYQQALKINPDYADAHYSLGNALVQNGDVGQAIVQYQQALKINPDFADAQNNLAWELATAAQASLRNGQQAMKLAQQANQLAGGQDPIVLHTLAAAYAETGRFGDARQSAQKAMDLARAAGQTDLMNKIAGELKLYTAGLPYHQENK